MTSVRAIPIKIPKPVVQFQDTILTEIIMPATAAIEPTDKSIPPVRTTRSIPIAISMIGVFCRRRLKMFCVLRNTGDRIAEMMISAAKINMALYLIRNSFTVSFFLICIISVLPVVFIYFLPPLTV